MYPSTPDKNAYDSSDDEISSADELVSAHCNSSRYPKAGQSSVLRLREIVERKRLNSKKVAQNLE